MKSFQSMAWSTCEGDEANLVFMMTGAISKVVGWPSFHCLAGSDRLSVYMVNNGQHHKLVIQVKAKINAGQPDEFEWPIVAEYMLYDRPHGERVNFRAFLEELRQNAAGQHFQLNFKFSLVIDRFDGQGNAVPKMSENGKTRGRMLAQILGFEIVPFTKRPSVVNPSLVAPITKPNIIHGSID